MAGISKRKSSSTVTPSPFERVMYIPSKAIGLVIGKGGSNLKKFQQIPGISSVKCSTMGKVQIHADSQPALEAVEFSVEDLVSFALSKNNGYYPEYFAFCFCKSVQDPLLAVNNFSFERFSGAVSNLTERDIESRTPFFCLKSAQNCDDSITALEDDADILWAEADSKLFFHLDWDLTAYRANLQACLESIIVHQQETTRTIKLSVRFGKLLFHGSSQSELEHGGFMAAGHLQDLCRRKLLKQRFSTACSDSAIKDPGLPLQLQAFGYLKASTRKKIIIVVKELQEKKIQFKVSVRVECNEGLSEKMAITRVRSQRKRHGFVTFCREGSDKADFRLGVMTHGTDIDASPEMKEWIEEAWKNRTPDGLLVFDPSKGFHLLNIRYKDADTYVTLDWKFRVARIMDGDRSNRLTKRSECVVCSRWFKTIADNLEEDNVGLAMENVQALVKQAAMLSYVMDMPNSRV